MTQQVLRKTCVQQLCPAVHFAVWSYGALTCRACMGKEGEEGKEG